MLLIANTLMLKAQNSNANPNAGGNNNGTNWLPNNGNVSVGTLQPNYKLQVICNSNFTESATFNTNVEVGSSLELAGPVKMSKGLDVLEDLTIFRDLKIPTLINMNGGDGYLGTDPKGKIIKAPLSNLLGRLILHPKKLV